MSEHRPPPELAGYVLGVLRDEEAAAFEAHLARCERCRVEVAELSPLPALLEQAAPAVATPAQLRERTFRAVRRAASTRMRWRTALAVAALAVAAAFVVAVWPTADEPFEVPLVAASGSRAHGVAYVTRSAEGLRVEMELSDLPATPEGTHYECWYVAPDDRLGQPRRVTGGTFVSEGGDVRVTMFTAADPRRYPLLEITLEQDDGNPSRGGKVMLRSRPRPAR